MGAFFANGRAFSKREFRSVFNASMIAQRLSLAVCLADDNDFNTKSSSTGK
jgi:hypothetical protein